MATIVLSAVGAAIGGSIGGSVAGLSTALIGRAVGAVIGNAIDQSLLGSASQAVETGRVDRFRLTGASEGAPVAELYGRNRIAGQVIWASRFEETTETTGGGSGKGTRRAASPEITTYYYRVSLAIGLCHGEISRVGRIWADGVEIAPRDLNMRVYRGSETQMPDAKIEAVQGAGQAPAYRGLAYVVIEDLELRQFGNRVPQFSFEVMRADQGDEPGGDIVDAVRAVALMPGTGEYALATTTVYQADGPGSRRAVNINTPSAEPDLVTSLDALNGELPNAKAASLIISWFGNDLRMDRCEIKPKIEQNLSDGEDMPWKVSGLHRGSAEVVAQIDNRPVYGGTPTDQSVIEAIQTLHDRGQGVMFYPFVLMEQLAGNGLTDPYTGVADQPVLPWRGRITTSVAPGRTGTPDKTTAAASEVNVFFGTAQAGDFTVEGDTVSYSGPSEFSYRRFILHYAHLCALAGGVEAFCVGSELRGITQIRDGVSSFPAVAQLMALAADVRSILGPTAKISYAADWSEYFGYHPQDGSGDVLFHLDPLWSDPNIDFVGIDNYMPLSDWRDGYEHEDAHWGAIHDIEYLKSNVAGGEGYDWYYQSTTDRDDQIRTSIEDGAYNEDWVFRYKDLRSWWENAHYNRIGGMRDSAPTAWQPQSKPFWFTELGCAAVDKGTNQPNKFIDPKSSESTLPYYSTGRRDDLIQIQYLRAMAQYWGEPANNPVSDTYGAPMVDMSHAFVWAWDARPFPFFPSRTELWSDGENYRRGHWLNGRASSRTLESVVREICRKSGVEQVATDKLFGVVRGYVAADGAAARTALQPLMLAYGFDAIERDGVLVWRSRSGQVDGQIDPETLVLDGEGAGRLEALRMPEAELAGRVRLSFVESDADYDISAAEATLPDETQTTSAQSEFPLVLTGSEGRQITERWLAESRVARDRVRFSMPMSALPFGAGDVVEFGESGLFRIESSELSGYAQMEAVRMEPSAYLPSPEESLAVRARSFVTPVPVDPVFLDLPLLTGEEEPHAPHIAVAAEPWPGPVAVYSSGDGSSYGLNSIVPISGVIGVTQNAMSLAKAGLWDRGAPLAVKLVGGTLASAEQTRVLAGANAAAIGTGQDDIWEVFQFSDAVLSAPGTYEISTRLRGQAGSDALMPLEWPTGSLVVFLEPGRFTQLDTPSSQRGLSRYYRTGPAQRPVNDPVYVEDARAFDGVGLRPYAPAHLRAVPQGNGDLDLSWIRRTRIDGDLWQGADVPLGEAGEHYLVRVWIGGNMVRSQTVTAPSWIYDQAMQLIDGPPGAREIEVAQISDRFGPGLYRRIEVNV